MKRFKRQPGDMPKIEERLVRDFQRQAHHFVEDTPPREDMLEWMALMQHWGAPTRLLDWTYSFYAAAFFAICNATPGDTIAIWAIDFRWCRKRARERVRDVRGTSKGVRLPDVPFGKPRVAGVFPSTPFRMHERLVVQQGTFLVPGDPGLTFMDNLAAMDDGVSEVRVEKLRLAITGRRLEQGLHDLRRMNLTFASLYPGLDGFAKNGANMIPDLAGMPVAEEEW